MRFEISAVKATLKGIVEKNSPHGSRFRRQRPLGPVPTTTHIRCQFFLTEELLHYLIINSLQDRLLQ